MKGSERCAELVNLDLHHGEGVDFNCLSYRSWLVMGRVGLYIYLCNGTKYYKSCYGLQLAVSYLFCINIVKVNSDIGTSVDLIEYSGLPQV